MDGVETCILCGGPIEGSTLFKGGDWRVVRCGGCGLIRQWPPLPEEQAAAIYGNIYPSAAVVDNSAPAPTRKAGRVFLGMRDEIVSRHDRHGRMLDIGCSYGDLVGLFKDTGWQATGIDVCGSSVEDARRRGLDCRVSSVEGFKPEQPFDAISMHHVLEHVPDPIAALDRIKTWLAPGGTLHIRVPNVEASPLRRSRLVFVGELKPYEHLFYYSASTLTRTLQRAGLGCTVIPGGRYSLGAAVNAMIRTRLVASARWQRYNYFSPSAGKGAYFMVRRMYEASLFMLNWIPLSDDFELRAVASAKG